MKKTEWYLLVYVEYEGLSLISGHDTIDDVKEAYERAVKAIESAKKNWNLYYPEENQYPDFDTDEGYQIYVKATEGNPDWCDQYQDPDRLCIQRATSECVECVCNELNVGPKERILYNG